MNLEHDLAGVSTSCASERARQLFFCASGRDIDLRIIPVAERFALSGQVLGPNCVGSVEIVNRSAGVMASADSQATPLDDLGRFGFAGLPAGVFSVTLRLGHDQVHLPLIEVGRLRR